MASRPNTVFIAAIAKKICVARWWLVPAFAAFAVALAICAQRNLYDDELPLFRWFAMPFGRLIDGVNASDVHPPGMYLLGKLAWTAFGSPRWMTVVPLGLWFIAVALFVVRTGALLTDSWSRWLYAFIAFFHPHALMWTNTIRWYPSWSAWVLLSLAFGPLGPVKRASDQRPRPPATPTAVALGCLGGLLFYFSYLSFLWLPCFGLCWLVRYGLGQRSLRTLAMVVGLSLLLAATQLVAFFNVHVHGAASQFGSILYGAGRLLHGLTIGEAILPWHPIGVLALVAFATVAIVASKRGKRARQEARALAPRWQTEHQRWLAAVAVWVGTLLVAAILTGLAARPRSFVVLVVPCALLFAAGLQRLRDHRWRLVLSSAIAAWLALGAGHLIWRRGTAKAGFNDHPEAIAEKIIELAHGRPTVVFTIDKMLLYELNRRRVGRALPLTVCSIEADFIHRLGPAPQRISPPPQLVFTVRTFVGSHADQTAQLAEAFTRVDELIAADQRRQLELGLDPDAVIKRWLTSRSLPDYRYRITWGSLAPRPAAQTSAPASAPNGAVLQLCRRFARLGYYPDGWSFPPR